VAAGLAKQGAQGLGCEAEGKHITTGWGAGGRSWAAIYTSYRVGRRGISPIIAAERREAAIGCASSRNGYHLRQQMLSI